MAAVQFDDDYREALVLSDGRRVTLRAYVRPHEELRRMLLEGFSRLSDDSRHMRFFSGKPRLTESEVDYLVALDGHQHMAIGALEQDDDGSVRGVGVARFVRLGPDSTVAEPAVTVVDDAQGLGLGTLLLHRLVQAARERGVTHFRAEFLGQNERVRKLLLDVVPDAMFHPDGQGVLIAELPLDTRAAAPDHPTQLNDLIRRVLKQHGGR